MHYGTVKAFDPVRGIGLITPDNGKRNIRLTQSAVNEAGLGQVAAGQKLGFDIRSGGRGPTAENLWATWSNR